LLEAGIKLAYIIHLQVFLIELDYICL